MCDSEGGEGGGGQLQKSALSEPKLFPDLVT